MILSNGTAVSAQIDTIADVTPIFSDASYYGRSSIELSGAFAAYGALFKSQLWVNILVRKLAFATARLPVVVRRQTGKGTEIEPGPLADLLATPNDRLDPFKLWLWTSATYDVYGEAFWLKLRDQKGRVRELHPMHPTNVIVRRSPDTGEVEYIYSSGVRNVSFLPPIPAADVVPFMGYNPDNLQRGISNLEPLRQTLFSEDASRRATASWWQRGARPSIALQHPGELSEPAQARLKKTWDQQHAGADLMGGTAILEEGMKAQVIQLSAEEMQYIESRKLNREEVCAAYDTPPPVVHILDRATFSNITEQMRSMYRDTMAPRLGLFESVLKHHLVPDFDKSGEVGPTFALDQVLRGDFETRATAVGTLIEKGVMKPSEGRPLFDLDDAGPAADKLYANSQLQELGSPAERVTITAQPPASPGETAVAEDTAEAAAAQRDQALADAQAQAAAAAAASQAPVNGGVRQRQLVPQPVAPVRRGGRPPKKQQEQE
ncbi:phage portal protein, HK97 family [Frankineae bacterium MT45]|nr:phage portal protein, HK97 family [Frankineae bacterium MT45]